MIALGVSVAEYFGHRTDVEELITPVYGDRHNCPFMNHICIKLAKGKKPVCSIRKKSKLLWIVCPHRLCSTLKQILISNYQISMLKSVADIIYNDNLPLSDILIKRDQKVQISPKRSYQADFIMARKVGGKLHQIQAIVEMQGGGETSHTGKISKQVEEWETNPDRNNIILASLIKESGTIETNAWRRQQEQFIVKGNVAVQTGGRMVFCIGVPLYDYLMAKINKQALQDLRNFNWSLALIAISEDTAKSPHPGPIPLKIDTERMLFTNYHNFVNELTHQGGPDPNLFKGTFLGLDGSSITI